MKLIEKQRVFAAELGSLLGYVHSRGAALALYGSSSRYTNPQGPRITIRLGEGYVGDTQTAADSDPDDDDRAAHRRDGGHYKRIAIDLIVEVNGRWIKSSSHPVYKVLGEWWESRGSLYPGLRFCNGRTWGDAGHFSIEDGGVQ